MKNTIRSHLAALLLLTVFCTGRGEAEVVILGTRVIYTFRARLERTSGKVAAGRIERPVAVRVTFR